MTGRRVASGLLEVVQRYASHAEAAIAAGATGDQSGFHAALDARDRLAREGDALAWAVVAARAGGDAATRREIDGLLVAVRTESERARALDVALGARAREMRLDLARQLDDLRQDEAARAAYAPSDAGRDRALDVRR